jgi:hypothetical protein
MTACCGEVLEWHRTTKGEPGRSTLGTESQPVPHPPGTPAIGSVETERGTTAKIWLRARVAFYKPFAPLARFPEHEIFTGGV